MSEILTAVFTILGGYLVFVLGQMTLKFLIEPIHKQSEIIGEIAHSLIFYANIYSSPQGVRNGELAESSTVLRRLAGDLIAKTHVIKIYSIWELLHLVPKRVAIWEAHSNLVELSNVVPETRARDIHDMRMKIEELLNIKPRSSKSK